MFVTVGRKAGACNHEHETRAEAEHCLAEHQKEIRRLEKPPSDRIILEIDTLDDLDEILAIY